MQYHLISVGVQERFISGLGPFDTDICSFWEVWFLKGFLAMIFTKKNPESRILSQHNNWFLQQLKISHKGKPISFWYRLPKTLLDYVLTYDGGYNLSSIERYTILTYCRFLKFILKDFSISVQMGLRKQKIRILFL